HPSERLSRAQKRAAEAGSQMLVPFAGGQLDKGALGQDGRGVDERVEARQTCESRSHLLFVRHIAALAPAQRDGIPTLLLELGDDGAAYAARASGDDGQGLQRPATSARAVS